MRSRWRGSVSTGSIISVPCRRIAVRASGVLLTCARRDFLIPAAVTAQGARLGPVGCPAPDSDPRLVVVRIHCF